MVYICEEKWVEMRTQQPVKFKFQVQIPEEYYIIIIWNNLRLLLPKKYATW